MIDSIWSSLARLLTVLSLAVLAEAGLAAALFTGVHYAFGTELGTCVVWWVVGASAGNIARLVKDTD